jgi:hypothetical protein
MVGTVTTMRRRLIALAAAYAIALQAVVASFAALAAAGTAVPGLCTSAPREQPRHDTGHATACIACPVHCNNGGLSGAPPAGVEMSAPRVATDRGAYALPQIEARGTARDRPPSRAPPVA